MPSRKRRVNIEENVDADSRDVKVTEEHSVDESNDSLREQEDERYTPSKG